MDSISTASKPAPPPMRNSVPTMSHQPRSASNARRQLPLPPQTIRGTINDITSGVKFHGDAVSDLENDIMKAGGLMNYMKAKVGKK